ncbi:transposase [Dendrosporobacter quercicolus]
MNYSKLNAAYSRLGRIERAPKRLFKISVYGYMNGIYSSRKLEQACQRDVNFMYLLGREKAPDHATQAYLLTVPSLRPMPTATALSGKNQRKPMRKRCRPN